MSPARNQDLLPANPPDLLPLRAKPFAPSSTAIRSLLLLAVFYTLYIARGLLLPIVLALLASVLLQPIVRRLSRYVRRSIGAAIVLGLFLIALASLTFLVLEPTRQWVVELPGLVDGARERLEGLARPVDDMRAATEQVEAIALPESSEARPEIQVDTDPSLLETLLARTRSVMGGTLVLIPLLFFLLASEELFLLKLVRLLPGMKDQRLCTSLCRAIEADVGRYLLTIAIINSVLGLVVGLTMAAFGVPNPALWGLLAALLNFIPYLGMLTLATLLTLTLAVSANGWTEIAIPVLVYVALTTSEATFITPFALGRRLALDPVVIFLGLLLWGWLWGVIGALLAVPMLVTLKIVCDHVSPGGSLASLLGRSPEPSPARPLP